MEGGEVGHARGALLLVEAVHDDQLDQRGERRRPLVDEVGDGSGDGRLFRLGGSAASRLRAQARVFI